MAVSHNYYVSRLGRVVAGRLSKTAPFFPFTRIKKLNINSKSQSFVGARCTNLHIYDLTKDPVFRRFIS
jgi:hypothetical protein